VPEKRHSLIVQELFFFFYAGLGKAGTLSGGEHNGPEVLCCHWNTYPADIK
jgi:hypothetical protein